MVTTSKLLMFLAVYPLAVCREIFSSSKLYPYNKQYGTYKMPPVRSIADSSSLSVPPDPTCLQYRTTHT